MIPIKSIKDISEIVKNKRKNSGFTQSELAGLCNTGVRFIVDLEAGKPTCQIDKVLHILHMLGIKIYVNEPTDYQTIISQTNKSDLKAAERKTKYGK